MPLNTNLIMFPIHSIHLKPALCNGPYVHKKRNHRNAIPVQNGKRYTT